MKNTSRNTPCPSHHSDPRIVIVLVRYHRPTFYANIYSAQQRMFAGRYS
jgi:hypothetical protein